MKKFMIIKAWHLLICTSATVLFLVACDRHNNPKVVSSNPPANYSGYEFVFSGITFNLEFVPKKLERSTGFGPLPISKLKFDGRTAFIIEDTLIIDHLLVGAISSGDQVKIRGNVVSINDSTISRKPMPEGISQRLKHTQYPWRTLGPFFVCQETWRPSESVRFYPAENRYELNLERFRLTVTDGRLFIDNELIEGVKDGSCFVFEGNKYFVYGKGGENQIPEKQQKEPSPAPRSKEKG